MNHSNNQLKYLNNFSTDFTDEIIIGDSQITGNAGDHGVELNIHEAPIQKNTDPNSQNYLLNFSILSFALIAFFLIFSKIISTTLLSFNSLSTSIFFSGYFLLFIASMFLIMRKKMLTLEVNEDNLLIKSFPTLNKKIPLNQILKCELNTLENGSFNYSNKIRFALNENGNKYKQPLNSGITLQLINGRHIIIGSKKE